MPQKLWAAHWSLSHWGGRLAAPSPRTLPPAVSPVGPGFQNNRHCFYDKSNTDETDADAVVDRN